MLLGDSDHLSGQYLIQPIERFRGAFRDDAGEIFVGKSYLRENHFGLVSLRDEFDGHLRGGRPDLRSNRVNIDTAAVKGGPLTAAIFDDSTPVPIGFLQEG